MKYIYIILALLYALSPYDLIPDMISGLGWLDDAVVLGLLLRFMYMYRKQARRGERYREQFRRAADQGAAHEENRSGQTGAGMDETRTSGDPHETLGVERGASQEDIKRAYRELVNKYHPDKVAHLGEEFQKLAEMRFKEIQQAYQVLKKP